MSGIMQLHQLRQMEQMRGEEPFQEPIPTGGRPEGISREQMGWGTAGLATGLAPGAGIADAFGYLPDPFAVGEQYPSMAENVRQGQWADVGMQALGLGADALTAIGPPGIAAGTMIRGARAAGRADPAVTAAREAPVSPPDPSEPRFELPSSRTQPQKLSVGERGVFNDMGNPVALNREEMQNFSDWFGRSVARRGDRPAVMYHGTLSGFDTFEVGDIGFHVGTQQQANRRINFKRKNNMPHFPIVDRQGNVVVAPQQGAVMPVYAKAENPLRMPDVGEWGDPLQVYENLPQNFRNQIDPEFYDEIQSIRSSYEDFSAYLTDPEVVDALGEIRDVLRRAGHDSIAYENLGEGPGHSLILFEPTQLKSATGNVGRFDPTVPAITAGVGAGAVGLGVMQRDPVEEDRESFRRALQERGL